MCTRTDGTFDLAAALLVEAEGLTGGWKLVKESKYATVYKKAGGDGGTTSFMFATTPESNAGVPYQFSLALGMDREFQIEKTKNDSDTLEYADLPKNEGDNVVEYTAIKLPPGLKNRDFLVMQHERVSDGVYEAFQRSTEHPDRPIQYSTEDKVNNPTGKKRTFIRAYQCVYIRTESVDGGATSSTKGVIALDMRGEFSPKIMDVLLGAFRFVFCRRQLQDRSVSKKNNAVYGLNWMD